MAATKQAKARAKGPGSNTNQPVDAVSHFALVLSTALRNVANMLMVAITLASVLVCLFAAKRIF